MTSANTEIEPTERKSKLSTALKVVGVVAIVGGVAAAIWLGPSIIGGALAGAGAKIAYTGAKMAGKSVIGG